MRQRTERERRAGRDRTDGETVAAWSADDGGAFSVAAAQRPAGASWSAPVELSDEPAELVYPQVALGVGLAGDAIALWAHGRRVATCCGRLVVLAAAVGRLRS